MTEQSPHSDESYATQPEVNTLENRIRDLRSQISDLAIDVDSHKANIARCAGGGVFLFALAALALVLEKKRDTVRENQVAELGKELEQLLKRKDRLTE
jgi:hypothetical protein